MTQKERLLNTLFGTQGEEHLNLKFYRGFSDDISPEDLCAEANKALFQASMGLAVPETVFGDSTSKTVDLSTRF